MTSPRQRKKRLAILKLRKKQQEQQKPVEAPKEVVVESLPVQKPKKLKVGLVEMKPQEEVVEQKKEEVKPSTKE